MRYDSDDDYQSKEGTTQEGTFTVRRTEEYILPDSDDEPVDPHIYPAVPQAPLPTTSDQIPTSAPSPVPSSTASDREAHNQAFLAADCDDETDDWLHYPEYDPIYQLIPQGLRPLTEREQANRYWPNYDSEQSEHSDEPPRDLRDEYPEHFEEAEQEEYRRYRLRGGEKRYRPSDIGDEDIYRTPNLPLSSAATDGCYLDDHEHLSPSIDRLISWDYRQSIRPWYNNLSPPPTNLAELEQRWLLNWSQTHERSGTKPQQEPSVPTPLPPDSAHVPAQTAPTERLYKSLPLLCERSTQTPIVRVAEKGTLARQPTGKPKWTQYYASHCHTSSLPTKPASPADGKYECTCATGSTHCQCVRS